MRSRDRIGTTRITHLLAAGALAAAALTSTFALATTTAASPASAASAAESAAGATRTTVTLKVAHCDGCTLRLVHAVDGHQHVWQSGWKDASDGVVHWKVAATRTAGMSIELRAPWEERTGYVTNAVMRYAGHRAGDKVSVRDARSRHRAAGCFAGTDQDRVSIRLRAKAIPIDGLGGPGTATVFFATRTQAFEAPMVHTGNGAIGNQDAFWCAGDSA